MSICLSVIRLYLLFNSFFIQTGKPVVLYFWRKTHVNERNAILDVLIVVQKRKRQWWFLSHYCSWLYLDWEYKYRKFVHMNGQENATTAETVDIPPPFTPRSPISRVDENLRVRSSQLFSGSCRLESVYDKIEFS